MDILILIVKLIFGLAGLAIIPAGYIICKDYYHKWYGIFVMLFGLFIIAVVLTDQIV